MVSNLIRLRDAKKRDFNAWMRVLQIGHELMFEVVRGGRNGQKFLFGWSSKVGKVLVLAN